MDYAKLKLPLCEPVVLYQPSRISSATLGGGRGSLMQCMHEHCFLTAGKITFVMNMCITFETEWGYVHCKYVSSW